MELLDRMYKNKDAEKAQEPHTGTGALRAAKVPATDLDLGGWQ